LRRLLRIPDPFRAEPDGQQRFHPLGRLGPAYAIGEETRRRRLALAYRLHWLGGLASLGFLLIWLAVYRGRDPLMFVAPPLLAYLLVLMAYRLALRFLLRGVPVAESRWQPASADAEPASGDDP